MSEETKTEEKKEETRRGDRGEVGTATAGLTIRQKWHAAAFRRESANDKHNPNRTIYVRLEGTPSLKQFARQLVKEGDSTAKEWFANKLGAKNQKRTDANIKAAKDAAQATKAAKKSKGKK